MTFQFSEPCQYASRVPQMSERGQSPLYSSFNSAGEDVRERERLATEARDKRFKLQTKAGKLARALYRRDGTKLRVAFCGNKPTGAVVSLKRSEAGRVVVGGVETCGSIWSCPVCAGKIIQKRREEVRNAITGHWADNGSVYMMAFTASHHRGEELQIVKERITGSWKKMLQGHWKETCNEFGISGYIKALEVTHGEANGWHPHVHILFFLDHILSDCDRSNLEIKLFEKWDRIVQREQRNQGADTVEQCNPALFNLELCATPAAAGDYVAKWGADSEIANLHAKAGRNGGRSPFELLDLASENGAKAGRCGRLFQEFAKVFKGARHLTWSKGLKARFGIGEEEDTDIANEEIEAVKVADIDGKSFYRMARLGFKLRLIKAAERGGQQAVYAEMREINCSIEQSEIDRQRREYYFDGVIPDDVDNPIFYS